MPEITSHLGIKYVLLELYYDLSVAAFVPMSEEKSLRNTSVNKCSYINFG